MDYASRQLRLRGAIKLPRMEGLLVTHLPNVRYLCGFTGSSGVLLLTEERSVFFSDGRYIAQAKEEVRNARVVIGRKAALVSAAEWLVALRAARRRGFVVGIEGEYFTVAARARLAKMLGLGFRVKATSALVEQMRMVKDSDEIKLIRAAVQMGAGLFDITVNRIRAGVRERDVATELEYDARESGAEQMSFQTIIASGERSALPHGVASAAKIPAKGFVVCDFGVILAGYCSDMTRTVHVGQPGREARRAYEAVREAQQAAINAVKPGATVGKVDDAARKVLRRHNLAKYFTHSTGHGVGLEIHEAPRIAAGQTEVLQPGMVITIEPGVYIPRMWGIRIEDMVLVTETGCEVLTPTTKELITI
jgi:Xaa-Pro aminopeptidase